MKKSIQKKVEGFFSKYPLYHHDKGSILIYADTTPDGIYYLETGQVRQYDITDKGLEVVVNVFKESAFFPMMWAINNTPNQYFYEVSAESSTRKAPTNEVIEFLKANSDVTYDLLSRVYSGTEGLQRRMAHLMGGTSQSRLLFELAVECGRFGVKDKSGVYALQLTEDELASRSGLSRETVSRKLNKLKSQGLVTVNHGTISVKDLARLQMMLGSNL